MYEVHWSNFDIWPGYNTVAEAIAAAIDGHSKDEIKEMFQIEKFSISESVVYSMTDSLGIFGFYIKKK